MPPFLKGVIIIEQIHNNENENELLKYAVQNGIIDLSYVQEMIAMKKRQEILQKHPYSIWQGSNGKWFTYLPDKEKGRKLIKRSDQKGIENLVVDYYKKLDDLPKTFDDVYKHWRTVKDIQVSDNTVCKYNSDYIRYFQDTEFSKKKIDSITEEDIIVFLVSTTKRLELCKEACKSLYGYVKNTIRSARINKLITDDPMQFLEPKQFYQHCTQPKATKSKTISDDDMKLILDQIHRDNTNQPEYIPVYAVRLAMLTGMRVGELAALSWDRIMDEYIIIDRSEKYNKKTKQYFIDTTKNGKERIFPITKEIRELLDQVKKVEMQNGYLCEWVFANDKGRVHTSTLCACLKNKCVQLKIDQRGIHALRKTLNSKMRCDGVSSTVAASLLGHSPQVNEKYYTFDVADITEKAQIVAKINQKIG